MKKSILLITGLCLLCLSITFMSCEGDSSTGGNGGNGGDGLHPSSLVGLWNSISTIMYGIITTNSNQTAVDQLFAQCTGNIAVTGNQSATLTYMIAGEDDGELFVLASNVSIWELMVEGGMMMKSKGGIMKFKSGIMMPMKQTSAGVPVPLLKADVTYPVHLFAVMEEMAMFLTMTSPNDTTMYLGTLDGITYDPSSFTLSVENVTLTGLVPPYSTVTLNGQMQNAIINIPANTPTVVMTQDYSDMITVTLDINADGTYMRLFDYGFGDSDTTNGTWEVTSGNNLFIIDYYIENGDTMDIDTSYSTYAFNGDNLVITENEDACIDEEYPEECLADIEEQLGIDEGSLVSAIEQMEMTFTKTGAAKL